MDRFSFSPIAAMDERIRECPGLTTEDIEFLQRVESCMAITADVSRANLLLCTQLAPGLALIASHAAPHSISSLYPENASERTFTSHDQPLILAALAHARGGSRRWNVLKFGAPVIQEVFPVRNLAGKVLAAFVVESNMIAHERQKRRNRYFQQAVRWLQSMCMRGEIDNSAALSEFGIYDGVYLVDCYRNVVYMSGVASNMFRMIGLPTNPGRQNLATLEEIDQLLVTQTFSTDRCQELRTESEDGRIWIRKAIPLHGPSSSRWLRWLGFSWLGLNRDDDEHGVDAVMVLLHNATEAVATQRELEVKSAIIQEVHHRIKNNLQNVASILRLQARRTSNEETRQHLSDAVNRVLSMSVIHEFLSHDEHRPINMRDVCQRIASQVVEVSRRPSQQIDVKVQGPSIWLPASQATPVALVVNELLLNALEHGVAERSQGSIVVGLADLGDTVHLQVQDDGKGLPANFDRHKSSSLGLQIIETLVTSDLKGALALESRSGGGAQATVSFPKRPLNE